MGHMSKHALKAQPVPKKVKSAFVSEREISQAQLIVSAKTSNWDFEGRTREDVLAEAERLEQDGLTVAAGRIRRAAYGMRADTTRAAVAERRSNHV